MSKPKIKKIIPFDATLDYQISFSWDGNQCYGNQIQIYNNSTNALIYDNSVTSFQLMHTIPANTLTNGIDYTIKVRVWDVNNKYSDYSYPVLFKCLETPIISFTNLNANQIIHNTYYNFEFTYTQNNGELLNSFQIILYNSEKIQISTTGIQNASNKLAGVLSGFIDNTQYYVRVTGTTINEMPVDSGYINFSVDYLIPDNYSQLIVENTNDGAIKVSSNVALITGKYNNGNPSYINNNEIDLTVNKKPIRQIDIEIDGNPIEFSNSYESTDEIVYDDGFTISGDFTREIIVRNLLPYTTCYQESNGNDTLTVKYMLGKFSGSEIKQCYFLLTVSNSLSEYRISTSPMTILPSDQKVAILIQRKNNLYSMSTTLV